MKSIYAKRFVFVMVFFSVFILMACGGPKAKAENEVLQDVIDTGIFKKYIANSNTADYTIEIYNRMTTTEEKIDTMEFNIQLIPILQK